MISYASIYKYLGLVLDAYLDYSVTAKFVAQSASRGLGLVIDKCKTVGGVPYNVFTKLYDSIVWPMISYGAAIWGHKEFTCISAVQSRTMRFFLGIGKYTRNAAVLGEMGWIPPSIRQWTSIAAFWSRMSCINSHRLNKCNSLSASDKARASSCRNRHFG